jgi:hypothetical protein
VSERDFSSQTAERLDADQRQAWFKARRKEADRKGARWHRFTFDEKTGVLLYEGWKVRPASEQHISGPGAAP